MAWSRRPATVVRSQLDRIASTCSAGSDFGGSDKRQFAYRENRAGEIGGDIPTLVQAAQEAA